MEKMQSVSTKQISAERTRLSALRDELCELLVASGREIIVRQVSCNTGTTFDIV